MCVCLQFILWCLLAIFLVLRGLQKLGHFRNNFIPKCNFLGLVPLLHSRFQIENEIFLLQFCKLRPRYWRRTRVGWIWRPERKELNSITWLKRLLNIVLQQVSESLVYRVLHLASNPLNKVHGLRTSEILKRNKI